ncbi:SDR family NAD(P)-dependent oxidoreductase [Rouxiella badensis]|uniref:SDR family NAD(P)-dependent oxidoreductase n=1 Tax=Rouxiella badensis TaxID=1646377 RepID=UPI0022A9FFF3|nr:SDR family oxidoreductase [Rouxiella badensis]WAT09671.1 SDR family oxidoreductase [Rouxiella badensis]
MKSFNRLEGKVAIVTGAATGIGRAIAIAFANEGAKVVATTNRNIEGLKETQSMASAGSIHIIQADSAVARDVDGIIKYAESEFGKLDIICNNAGIVTDALLADISEEDWDRTIDINLKGAFLGSKYAIPAMQRNGSGVIINIGSVNSFVGEDLHAAYCASKGGVLMLTRCAALEYAKDNIRANVICPGWIDTPMNTEYIENLGGLDAVEKMLKSVQPLGTGKPEQIASVAVFLACEESSLITGTSILVDGGLTAQ